MRLSTLVWAAVLGNLAVDAQLAQQQHQQPAERQQITFGIAQGAQLRTERGIGAREGTKGEPSGSDAAEPPGPLARAAAVHEHPGPISGDSSADELYQLALSLLDSLSAHSPDPPPTPYSVHLVSSASALDRLETVLGHSVTGYVFRSVRKALGSLVTSSSSLPLRKQAQNRSEAVLRAVVARLKAVLNARDSSETSEPAQRTASPQGGAGARSGEGEGVGALASEWRKKLRAAGVKGDVLLADEEISEAWEEVLDVAERAAAAGSADALVLLGDLYLGGASGLQPDTQRAATFYQQASEAHGSGEAQYKLGFLYGGNYGSAMGGLEGEGHQGSALLHYTFAALSGHVPASMTVGYRHWAGIGTKPSCKAALPWYKAAAAAAVRSFNSGPPGGRHLPPPKIRLSDLDDGPYGPGASSSRGSLSTGGSTAQTQQEWDDLVEYHLFHAEHGDVSYQYRLGRLYYQGFGARGLGGARGAMRGRLQPTRLGAGPSDGLWDGGRDFYRASKWFTRIARRLWPSDPREATWDPAWGPVGSGANRAQGKATAAAAAARGAGARTPAAAGPGPRIGYFDPTKDRKNDKLDPHSTMVAGLAAGYLGRMYLRGEGLPVNYAKAFLWFSRGQKQGDRESNNGLGIMYRDGLGVERDLKKANMLFHAAAQQDLPEAQVNLGKFHFGNGDFVLANTYFVHAIRADTTRSPDTFQAYYYLAELAERSPTDSCPTAVSFYKRVAERGDWDHEVWWEAERARERGDLRTALLGYWMMAERGYEAAQNNMAWILDADKQRLRLPLLDATLPESSRAVRQLDRLALTYWTRSAAQDNVDSLVKMGDYYYRGLGTEDGQPRPEKAAGCYQSAATTRFSAMAMWNLGWMHEIGKGVPQDFHLAKRNYDMALETSSDALFPSTLSLLGLYARALYHAVTESGDDELKALSLFGREPDPDGVGAGFAEHGLWTFGRAWRDVQRRWGVDPGPDPGARPLEAEDPLAGDAGGAAADGQRDARAVQRALEGGEDPLDWDGYRGRGAARGDNEDDELFLEDEGDFGGTVAIVALSMLLAWLLYFRHRPAHQNRAHGAEPAADAANPPAAAPAASPQPPPAPPAATTPSTPASAPESRPDHTGSSAGSESSRHTEHGADRGEEPPHPA